MASFLSCRIYQNDVRQIEEQPDFQPPPGGLRRSPTMHSVNSRLIHPSTQRSSSSTLLYISCCCCWGEASMCIYRFSNLWFVASVCEELHFSSSVARAAGSVPPSAGLDDLWAGAGSTTYPVPLPPSVLCSFSSDSQPRKLSRILSFEGFLSQNIGCSAFS